MTLAQALHAYTRGAARAEHAEAEKGTLRPGMLADIAVFGSDLFSLSPAEFADVEVALTMVDGKVVYRTA